MTSESPAPSPALVPTRHLGTLLSEARLRAGLRQKQVADPSQGLGDTALSLFETGKRLPSPTQLLALCNRLHVDHLAALLARTHDELSRAAADVAVTAPELADAAAKLGQRLWETTQQGPGAATGPRGAEGWTLQDFPSAFPNLVIVTGDKREPQPKSIGDIGVYSASPVDDRWIYELELPRDTEKVSDKEFVISTDERLRSVYGRRNLLVLGSPSSNHLARIVNRKAVFPFNTRAADELQLEGLLDELRSVTDKFTLEARMKENMGSLKNWMRAFFSGGILDPLKGDVHGIAGGYDRDYATITLAEHPWAADGDHEYVCIMVAGFHHPGTASALRFLRDPRHFEERPYGGVLEIRLDMDIVWEDRMQRLETRWETVRYTPEALLAGLTALIKKKEQGDLSELLNLGVDRMRSVRRLIEAWPKARHQRLGRVSSLS